LVLLIALRYWWVVRLADYGTSSPVIASSGVAWAIGVPGGIGAIHSALGERATGIELAAPAS
jgi:hypothetical protein